MKKEETNTFSEIFFKVIENDKEKSEAIDQMMYVLNRGKPSDRLWKTNDGYVYKVGEMATKHIVSCIKCLQGKSKTVIENISPKEKLEWIEVFKEELKSRKSK